MKAENKENKIQKETSLSKINDATDPDYYDDKYLIEENVELLKCITNLRDLPVILNHRLMIEKEISLLLGNNILIAKPYFNKIKWENLNKYKEKINAFQLFEFSDLNIQESIIMEIESLIKNSATNIALSNDSFILSKSKKSEKKNSGEKSNTEKSDNKNDNTNSKNKQKPSSNINKGEMNKYNDNDSSDDITWESDVEQRYSEIIENKKNKNNLVINNQEKKEKDYPENFIKVDDFRISNSLENIKFNHYNPNDKSSGSLFEGTLVNYLYDIFNIITNGNLCFYRNQKYYHNNIAYELDFQISNLKIKDFLFFIGLIYPNIPTLDDLTIIDTKNIFSNKERIFDNINNYNSSEMCVDILGEITVDILNIEIKKQEQINKYINLVELLKSNTGLNHKFNFSSKNKKIIVIITDGNIRKFFTLFNEKFKHKKKDKKKIELHTEDKPINKSKETSESLPKEQPKKLSNVQNNEIRESFPVVESNKSNIKSELRAKKKLEQNIYLTLKGKNICHLFVYVKDKKNSKFAFNKKMNYKFSELLKNNLNKPEKDIDKESFGEIQLLNELDFSNVYQNFYKDILFSKKLDILQNCIKKVDGRFMKSVQNLYINFLKTKILKNYIIEIFLKHFIFNSESINILKKFSPLISEEEKNKATNSNYNASIFELSYSDLYFNNYKKEEIKIDNYTNIENLSYFLYPHEINSIISNWLGNNKFNESKKIIILHKIENNSIFYGILTFLLDQDSTEKFIFISKENQQKIQLSSVYKKMFLYYFDSQDDLYKKVIQCISKEKLKNILYAKLINRYNYFDKILKNSIIINDEEKVSDEYLEQFLLKISQITSIYCNNDISEYKDNLFNLEKIKEIITKENKYLKEFEGYFFKQIISHLKINELKYLIKVKLEESLSQKLKKHKNELIDVYYKFYERIFSLFVIKKIKILIVDEVANFILKKKE